MNDLRKDFKALCEEREPLLVLDEDDFVSLIEKYKEIILQEYGKTAHQE